MRFSLLNVYQKTNTDTQKLFVVLKPFFNNTTHFRTSKSLRRFAIPKLAYDLKYLIYPDCLIYIKEILLHNYDNFYGAFNETQRKKTKKKLPKEKKYFYQNISNV